MERFSQSSRLVWSIRRELWENRFLYLGPLIVTAVVLFGTFVSVGTRVCLNFRAKLGEIAIGSLCGVAGLDDLVVDAYIG